MGKVKILVMAEFYQRLARIEESPLQGDLMLFDPEKSRFFVLNSTMAYLWRNCDGATSYKKIIDSVHTDFSDADAARVANEMQTALTELITLGLVVER